MGTVSISGTSYDIYGTEAGAKSYFAASVSSAATAYLAAEGGVKKQSLVTAARMFDRTTWTGDMTDPDTPQALAWPRTGVSDREGNAVATGVIPQDIIDGAYELAGSLLVTDSTVEASSNSGSNTRRTLTREKVGDLEVEAETEYFRPTTLTSGRWPTPVQELIGWALAGAGLAFSAVNGACDDSTFADNNWGFNLWGLP